MDIAKKKLLFFILPFFAFYFLLFSVNAENNVPAKVEDDLYQKCKSSYLLKDSVGANTHIKEFVSSYPKSEYMSEILYMQAFVQEDSDKAISMYKDVISKYPDTTWAVKSYFQLGHCYYLQGKYGEAAESYREIVVHFMDDELYWQARYWRSKSLMAKKDYDGAIYSLDTMRGSKSKEIENDTILMSLSECYMAKKDYAKTEEILHSLIKDFPESKWMPSAYRLLGDCLENNAKREDAKEFYQKVIQNYPKSLEAKKAKESLDSLPTTPETKIGTEQKKASPQLETPFLKATFEEAGTIQKPAQRETQKTDQVKTSSPPFNVDWKKDDESKPDNKQPKTPKTESHFCVQIGAFSIKSTADYLASQLKKKGYSVEVVTSSSKGKTLHKVRVGSFKTESEANQMSRKLLKEKDINSTIVVPND